VDAFRERRNLGVFADRARETERRVELVHRPVGLDAKGSLRDADAAGQARLARVSAHGADASHDAVSSWISLGSARTHVASALNVAPLADVPFADTVHLSSSIRTITRGVTSPTA